MTLEEFRTIWNDNKPLAYKYGTCKCPDLTALNKLNELGDCDGDMLYLIDGCYVYLKVRVNDILEKVTVDDIVLLIRCGVLFDGYQFKFLV